MTTTPQMSATLAVLNRLEAEGTIGRYAIAGAFAAFRFIEAALTEDLDLLVAIPSAGSGLVAIEPIFRRLRVLGYADFVHDGVLIEGWPVQFLPVADDLDAEALAQAESVEVPSGPGTVVTARALRAEHVIAKALSVGRGKDSARIERFLEENVVDLGALRGVLQRHGLIDKWHAFCRRMGVKDPLGG